MTGPELERRECLDAAWKNVNWLGERRRRGMPAWWLHEAQLREATLKLMVGSHSR